MVGYNQRLQRSQEDPFMYKLEGFSSSFGDIELSNFLCKPLEKYVNAPMCYPLYNNAIDGGNRCSGTTCTAILEMQKAIDAFIAKVELWKPLGADGGKIGAIGAGGYDGRVGPTTRLLAAAALTAAGELLRLAGRGDVPAAVVGPMRDIQEPYTHTKLVARFAPEIRDFLVRMTPQVESITEEIQANTSIPQSVYTSPPEYPPDLVKDLRAEDTRKKTSRRRSWFVVGGTLASAALLGLGIAAYHTNKETGSLFPKI